jgi:hypothetical protein
MIFNGGVGDEDPDMAWMRISSANADYTLRAEVLVGWFLCWAYSPMQGFKDNKN